MPRRSAAQRARSDENLAPDAQDGLFDREIQDDLLAQALERRQRAKEALVGPKAEFKEAHDTVKSKVDALELSPDETVRVGRFRLRLRRVEGGAISFETAPRRQLDIGLLE